MPYYSGSAASYGDLVTALQNACVAEGYTLSGEVLHKGNIFVRVWVDTWDNICTAAGIGVANYFPADQGIHIRGGTGIDGGNNLTGGGHLFSRIGQTRQNTIGTIGMPFTFPVSYRIFIQSAPDEVYLVVNSDVDRYQSLAFGHSPRAEQTGGSGGWYGACLPPTINHSQSSGINPEIIYASAGQSGSYGFPHVLGAAPAAPFFACPNEFGADPNSISNAFYDGGGPGVLYGTYTIHHGVDLPGGGWSGPSTSGPRAPVVACVDTFPLFGRWPLLLNAASPLLPITLRVGRPSSKHASIGQLANSRLFRIDHHDPDAIVTIGSEQWKVYPFYRKNADAPQGSTGFREDSGGLGWAIRYDGP